jgi:hypothetical protein
VAQFGASRSIPNDHPTVAMAERCAEYDRLEHEVEQILAQLAQVTTLQLELFRSRNYSHVHRVDRELENIVGEKERAIGALLQHLKEHKCQANGSFLSQ